MRRSPTVKANEIRLKRQNHEGCFLIVEGRDDRLFFEPFVDGDKCRIIVADGKLNVTDVVARLEAERFPGVIGVVDADFDHIECNRQSSDNLIVLETVDLEALLIRSPALDGVLAELGSKKKIEAFGKDVREVLVATAVWIGCLRLHSHRTSLNLKLQGLKYAKCIDTKSLEIDIHALVQEVKNRSQRPDLPCQDIVEELRSTHRSLVNPWLICYGKDMVEILALVLRKTLGSNKTKDVESVVIRRYLRLAFHRSDLEESELGRDLHSWAARNSGYCILRPA